MEPRSPRQLKVCSGRTCHPSAEVRATTSRTVSACFSSSSFASSAPRHRGPNGSQTPTAAATRRSDRMVRPSSSPRSTKETVASLTPASTATSDWRRPRRRRTARITDPTCTSSIAARCTGPLRRRLSTARRQADGPADSGGDSARRSPQPAPDRGRAVARPRAPSRAPRPRGGQAERRSQRRAAAATSAGPSAAASAGPAPADRARRLIARRHTGPHDAPADC
jgi:hypothetical protein